jgi:hypothetical protein
MPNRHELFLLKLPSQPVRIRHIGRHKCREPAITGQVEHFLIRLERGVFQENRTQRGEKARQKIDDFSRCTVARNTSRKVFLKGIKDD